MNSSNRVSFFDACARGARLIFDHFFLGILFVFIFSIILGSGWEFFKYSTSKEVTEWAIGVVGSLNAKYIGSEQIETLQQQITNNIDFVVHHAFHVGMSIILLLCMAITWLAWGLTSALNILFALYDTGTASIRMVRPSLHILAKMWLFLLIWSTFTLVGTIMIFISIPWILVSSYVFAYIADGYSFSTSIMQGIRLSEKHWRQLIAWWILFAKCWLLPHFFALLLQGILVAAYVCMYRTAIPRTTRA